MCFGLNKILGSACAWWLLWIHFYFLCYASNGHFNASTLYIMCFYLSLTPPWNCWWSSWFWFWSCACRWLEWWWRGFCMNHSTAQLNRPILNKQESSVNRSPPASLYWLANTLFSSYMMHINHCYFHLFALASHFRSYYSVSPQFHFPHKQSHAYTTTQSASPRSPFTAHFTHPVACSAPLPHLPQLSLGVKFLLFIPEMNFLGESEIHADYDPSTLSFSFSLPVLLIPLNSCTISLNVMN